MNDITDFYLLGESLNDTQRDIQLRVRKFAREDVLPVINDYWERAAFPFELLPKLAKLNVVGTFIEGYGCPGMDRLSAAMVSLEMSRADGSMNTFLGVQSGLTMGSIALLANEALRKELTEYLVEQAGDDTELAKQIIPNYPPAAKRIICDDGTWVKTLKRENVRLVSQGVNRIDETGVWLGDEHIEADVILLGTGFKASDFLLPMSVAGIGGKDLHETWGIDASAYLGSTLPGFPNFFCMYGPNTNTVIHGNLVFFLECQAVYMIDAIKTLATGGHKSMDLRADVFAEYDKEIVSESAKRTWGWSKTHSWYMNAEGRSTIMWPLPARNYFERTSKVRTEDYKLG